LAGAEADNACITTSTERLSTMPSSNNPTLPDGPDSTAQRDLETHPSGSAVPVAPTAAGPALPNPPSIRLYLHSPDHEIEIIEVTSTARLRDVITVEEDLIFLDGNDEPVDIGGCPARRGTSAAAR
jgi:hypothetical protein